MKQTFLDDEEPVTVPFFLWERAREGKLAGADLCIRRYEEVN